MLIPATLFGWVPLVLVIFALLPARRAMIASYLIAWLFLPMAGYDLPVLPPFNKMTATSYGVLLAAFIYHFDLLTAFRFRWFDAPAAVLCLVSPMITSLANGLGAWDGLASTVETTMMWGMPYFLGRVFIRDAEGLKDLAIGLFIGGLLYVPLCLYEIRMSPQLHRIVYGYHPHSFAQTMRFGGWRPTVFMQHGLMVGMWMAMAALVGVWLWWRKSVTSLFGAPMIVLVVGLGLVAVMCKSLGALALLVMGGGALALMQLTRQRWPLILLLAVAPTYMFARTAGLWQGQGALDVAAMIDEDRMKSLRFRMVNEDMLIDKALERPVFGWGGWGRFRVFNEAGKDISVTDGLWVITMGKNGLVGLFCLFATLLLPFFLLLKRHTGEELLERGPPAVALVVVVCLYAVDCLPNAMVNPIFVVCAGAVLGALANGSALAPAGDSVEAEPAADELSARRPMGSGRFVPLSQRL